MSIDGATWREWGHPWVADDALSKHLPEGLDFYEYHVIEDTYPEGLPSSGYEQGYRIPHPSDRGILLKWHGTTTGYSYGCRCGSCIAAIRAYQRELKERRR